MTRKHFETHPHVGSGRVGLAIADMQTLHRGHVGLLTEMLTACDVRIVGLGSANQHGTDGHPFTFEQRADMIRGVFGDAFRFVPLNDIDARSDLREWYAYVRRKIEGAGLPEPTDYFGGSEIDAHWYFHAFADPKDPRTDRPGTAVHESGSGSGKRLHLVDRSKTETPSGREIRLLIEMRDDRWKAYVPERLHRFVEMEYPPHLRQPVRLDDVLGKIPPDSKALATVRRNLKAVGGADAELSTASLETLDMVTSSGGPDDLRVTLLDATMKAAADSGAGFPVGTRLSSESGAKVFELKDDGRWRPLAGPDEKARWAREARERRGAA